MHTRLRVFWISVVAMLLTGCGVNRSFLPNSSASIGTILIPLSAPDANNAPDVWRYTRHHEQNKQDAPNPYSHEPFQLMAEANELYQYQINGLCFDHNAAITIDLKNTVQPYLSLQFRVSGDTQTYEARVNEAGVHQFQLTKLTRDNAWLTLGIMAYYQNFEAQIYLTTSSRSVCEPPRMVAGVLPFNREAASKPNPELNDALLSRFGFERQPVMVYRVELYWDAPVDLDLSSILPETRTKKTILSFLESPIDKGRHEGDVNYPCIAIQNEPKEALVWYLPPEDFAIHLNDLQFWTTLYDTCRFSETVIPYRLAVFDERTMDEDNPQPKGEVCGEVTLGVPQIVSLRQLLESSMPCEVEGMALIELIQRWIQYISTDMPDKTLATVRGMTHHAPYLYWWTGLGRLSVVLVRLGFVL